MFQFISNRVDPMQPVSECRLFFKYSTDYFSFNLVVFNSFRLEIVPTLLHVFVDIEATGQAVQFEMKFSYRRPMVSISTNSSNSIYLHNNLKGLLNSKFFILHSMT